MGKTSFKTHDPFVILEHLDGKIPVHVASGIICLMLKWNHAHDETLPPSKFDGLITSLLYVNIFCYFAQTMNRKLQRKESEVIKLIQKLKDGETLAGVDGRDATSTTKKIQDDKGASPVINYQDDEDDVLFGENRPTTKIGICKMMVRLQIRQISSWIQNSMTLLISQAKEVWSGLKLVLFEILSVFYQSSQNTKEPFRNLSSIHFVIRSMLSLISTISYQYTIFRLIVILAFRKDNFVEDTEEEDKYSKPVLYNRQYQPLMPKLVNGTEVDDPYDDSIPFEQKMSRHAGYVINNETALAAILVIDYSMQIFAIMLMMIGNLNIDMGSDTITDMMNEARFKYKFSTFMITASLTNLGVFMFIEREQQNYQFRLNKITAGIDSVIIALYIAFLTFVIVQNLYLPSPKKLDYYLDKTRIGKVLVLLLQATKFTLVIFGNMYWIAYFSYVDVPKECKCSYIFMAFQFIQYLQFLPSIFDLYQMSQLEKETLEISYRDKKQGFFNFKEAIQYAIKDKQEEAEDDEDKKKIQKELDALKSNTVKKGNAKKQLPANMNIVSNRSFTHNDAYLHSDKKDIENSQKDMHSEEEKSSSLHAFYKSNMIAPKLTFYMKSIMRQKFFLEELEYVQQVNFDGTPFMVDTNQTNVQGREKEIEGDKIRQREVQFSKMDLETKGFVTVLMYGVKFTSKNEDENIAKEGKVDSFELADQLILVSDKFKNEVMFSEQVKKIWRTLKDNNFKANCLEQILKKKENKESLSQELKDPEDLNFNEIRKIDCYRSFITKPVNEEKELQDLKNYLRHFAKRQSASDRTNEQDSESEEQVDEILRKLIKIRDLHNFESDDYENEMRFHLQYSLFSNRLSNSKEALAKFFEVILNQFLNQNEQMRKLYFRYVDNSLTDKELKGVDECMKMSNKELEKKVEECMKMSNEKLEKNQESDKKEAEAEINKKVVEATLKRIKFERFFYNTKTQTLCNSIINDVDDLYMKLESKFERMAQIIKDIANELNPPVESDKKRNYGKDAIIVRKGRTEAQNEKIKEILSHKKKLLRILQNGIDFFGWNVDLPLVGVMSGKEENKAKNRIQKLCRDFEACIDELQKVKSVEQGTAIGQEFTLMFPLKLEKGVQFRLFKMIQAKYKLKDEEYKKEGKSIKDHGIVFHERDLIRCMVRIDYQRDVNELSLVDQKREDLMFDFVDSKFQYLQHKLTKCFEFGTEVIQHKNPIQDYINAKGENDAFDEDDSKNKKLKADAEEEYNKRPSCIDMHGLQLIDLDPRNGKMKKFFYKEISDSKTDKIQEGDSFDGWHCVDCNARKEKETTFKFGTKQEINPIKLIREYTLDVDSNRSRGRFIRCMMRDPAGQSCLTSSDQVPIKDSTDSKDKLFTDFSFLEFTKYDGDSINDTLVMSLNTITAWRKKNSSNDFLTVGELFFNLMDIKPEEFEIHEKAEDEQRQINAAKLGDIDYTQDKNAREQVLIELRKREVLFEDNSKNKEALKVYFFKNGDPSAEKLQNAKKVYICQTQKKETLINTDKLKQKHVEYKFDEQPFCFVFVCEAEECTCPFGKRKFYCGSCGVMRLNSMRKPKFLEVSDDIYTYSFLSMLNDAEPDSKATKEVGQSKSTLPEQSSLYFKAQMIFFVQTTIICLLIYHNIFSSDKQEFMQSYPTLVFMQLLAAYLFHIQTLADAKNSYARILFLIRYPERFNKSLRSPALFLSAQQFMVNILCEMMNLATLAQQPSFQELIMNYVAFAGILDIDNIFMSTQLKFFKDLQQLQENPGDSRYLELYKNPKFHHTDKATKVARVTEQVLRFIYKVLYFYLFPVFVVPLGMLAWRATNDLVRQPNIKVDWSYLDDQFTYNIYFQIYSYIIVMIFVMLMYVMLYVYSLNESLEDNYEKVKAIASRNSRMIFTALIFVPFLIYGVSASITYFNDNLKEGAEELGYYMFWFNKGDWISHLECSDNEIKTYKDENPDDERKQVCYAFDIQEEEDQKWIVNLTNVYLMISIALNWYYTEDMDTFIDYVHFVFNCLMYPVLFYFTFLASYDLTFSPIKNVYKDQIANWNSIMDVTITDLLKPWEEFSIDRPAASNQEKFSGIIVQFYVIILAYLFYRVVYINPEFQSMLEEAVDKKEPENDYTFYQDEIEKIKNHDVVLDDFKEEFKELKNTEDQSEYIKKAKKFLLTEKPKTENKRSKTIIFKALFSILVLLFIVMCSIVFYKIFNENEWSLFPFLHRQLQKFEYGLWVVFVSPFEHYLFASIESMGAYLIVYAVLTVIFVLFAALMRYVFPDGSINTTVFVNEQQYEKVRMQVYLLFALTPLQIYATWNVGIFYATAVLFVSENAQQALDSGEAHDLLMNPALFVISVMSAPYMWLRNFLEVFFLSYAISFGGSFQENLKDFRLAGDDSFEKSRLVFWLLYMVAFSPLVYVFVLGKGEAQKKIDHFCKMVSGTLGEGGKILVKVLVIIILLVVVFPAIFYIALNGVAYYSITWTVVKAYEFIGSDETKQMAVGGVLAVIGLIVAVKSTDGESEDDEDNEENEENEQENQNKEDEDNEPKEKTQEEIAQEKSDLDKLYEAAMDNNLCEEEEQLDKDDKEQDVQLNNVTIIGLFILFMGGSIVPDINTKLHRDFYAFAFLGLLAALIMYNRQEDKEDSSWQKFIKWIRMIMACLGLLLIVQRPFAEAIKCYQKILGCDPGSFDDQFHFLGGICSKSDTFQVCPEPLIK